MVEQKSKQTEPEPMSLPHNHLSYSNLSVVTAEKAHQLTALTEKLLYTEVGSRVATERFKISGQFYLLKQNSQLGVQN